MPHSPNSFHIKKGDAYEVKALFKEFSKIVRRHVKNKIHQVDILDVGCATGELPHFLLTDLNTTVEVWGIDILPSLIQNAKERFGSYPIHFQRGDAQTFRLQKKFDVITLSSVLSYFDDPVPTIKNIIRHLKPGGIALISGIFNPWNIDVFIKLRLDGNRTMGPMSVLNQFSMERLVIKLGCSATFSEHVMPFDIHPQKEPVRSWTVKVNSKRFMTNGLQLLYNIQILQIKKPE